MKAFALAHGGGPDTEEAGCGDKEQCAIASQTQPGEEVSGERAVVYFSPLEHAS